VVGGLVCDRKSPKPLELFPLRSEVVGGLVCDRIHLIQMINLIVLLLDGLFDDFDLMILWGS